MLYVQFPFLVPPLAHALTTRYLFPLPKPTATSYPAHSHFNSMDLKLSLPHSFHLPSRFYQQVEKLHQTAWVCGTLQSVPPSKDTSWKQNKLPNFLCQAQGKVVSMWGWFPSQSYYIGVCLHNFNFIWVWWELQTEDVKYWSNLVSFLMKTNLLRKIWHSF